MDAIVAGAPLEGAATADAERDIGWRVLPEPAALDVPTQSFEDRAVPDALPEPPGAWIARAGLAFGALLLTAAFAWELYSVLAFVRLTPIQIPFLVLSTLAFGWIALGSLSAATGFLPLFADERPDTVALPARTCPLAQRMALLFPVYHEAPAGIAATIEAIATELTALQRAGQFDVFILSDTRGDTATGEEARAYGELARRLEGAIRVFYRRRRLNTEKKAGNIKDWVERFGGAYETFVILDADSVMSGETLIRLAGAMEEHPRAGLIQTVPRLVGGVTLFQRLQQYAAGVYGPSVAAGLAVWHRARGNYWGHNAIIRSRAFAAACGLPILPGARPFGGGILSHDFVEAALLQRAGWGVHMVPTTEGSYEGAPPNLIDLAVRDRRWAQGNIQHMALVARPGLTAMGRVHLLMGIMAYLVSAVWACSIVVGLVLALQGQQLIPSYFQDSKTLFPLWPVIDPGAAFRLFLATMAVVLLPKGLGLLLELRRVAMTAERGGSIRAIAAVVVETAFSMLIAPILMVTQTTAVAEILAGRDAGWKAQRRDGQPIGLLEVARFHWPHVLLGLALAGVCAIAAWELMAWMAPILLGLILAVPLTWLTARPAHPLLGELLSTPTDREPPAILERVAALSVDWTARLAEPPERAKPDLPHAA